MESIDEMHLEKPEEPGRERFDYRGQHRYLVTLPVHAERAAFSERETVFSVLGVLRDSAQQHLFDVYAYCFLPDRLGMIVRGKADTSDFRTFLQEFRTASGSAYEAGRGHALWSKKFQERVLRKEEETKESARQLFTLPVKAGLVRRAQDYALLGSFVQSLSDIFPPPERRDDRQQGAGRWGDRRTPPRPGSDAPEPRRSTGEFRRKEFGGGKRQGEWQGGHKGRTDAPREFRPGGHQGRSTGPREFRPGGHQGRSTGPREFRPGAHQGRSTGPRDFRPGGQRPRNMNTGEFRPGGQKPRSSGPREFRPGGQRGRTSGPGDFRPGARKFGGPPPSGSRKFHSPGPGHRGPRRGGPGGGEPRRGRPRPGGHGTSGRSGQGA